MTRRSGAAISRARTSLQTDDADLAVRLVHPPLRAWLLDTNAPGFIIAGDRLLYARLPNGPRPDRVLARLSLRAVRADPAEPVERAWPRTGRAPTVVDEATYRGGAWGPGST